MKGYSIFEDHPCNDVCKKCRNRNCKNDSTVVVCPNCHVHCTGETCYNDHLLIVCCRIPKCEDCGAFKMRNHICHGKKWCKFCREGVEYGRS